jgi:hypothetical protein
MNLLIRHALGIRRVFGDRVNKPVLRSALSALGLASD